MQSMRDVLKQSLGRSLSGLGEIDRLEAAWPVVCGATLAARATLFAYDSGIVHVEIPDPANDHWFDQLESMRPVLERELARIARVPVTAIHLHHARRK